MKKKYYIFELDTLGITLNIMSILIMIVFFALTIFVRPDITINFTLFTFILTLLIYFFLHEILHSIAYCIYGGSFKNIVYGIKLEKGVFYCLCKENISRKCILYSCVYPLIFIGIITYIIGIILNIPLLILLSIFNISGCIADIYTFIFIKKLKNDIEFSEMDNPLYFAIYADYDVSKIKHRGIKFVKESNTIDRKDLKKITISKPSYIILAVLLLMVIIDLVR